MATPQKILANGWILQPCTITTQSGVDIINLPDGHPGEQFTFNPKFILNATGLSPNTSHSLRVVGKDVDKYRTSSSTYPSTWVSEVLGSNVSLNRVSWTGIQSNSSGEIVGYEASLQDIPDPFYSLLMVPMSPGIYGCLVKNSLSNDADYVYSTIEYNDPNITDPDEKLRGLADTFDFPTQYNDNGVNRILYPIKNEVSYTLRLINNVGSTVKETVVTFTYVLAFDALLNDTRSETFDIFETPINLDLPTQEWSPLNCIGGDESEYSEDIIQRFVTNPTNQNLYLEALEIYHEGVDETYYLVNDRKSWDFTLEDDSIETHQPYGFAITLPTTDQGGVSEMSITVDNTDRFLSQFIADAKAYDTPVKCTYRVYAADDPTTPQLTPPLKYDLTDVTMNGFQISGKTRKIDVVNANFLTENYTRKRFPSLGS